MIIRLIVRLCCWLLMAVVPLAAATSAEAFRWQCTVTPAAAGKYSAAVTCQVDGGYLSGDFLQFTAVERSGKSQNLPLNTSAEVKYSNGTHRWNFQLSERPAEIFVEFQGCLTGQDNSGEICLMPEKRVLWPTPEPPAPQIPPVEAANTAELPVILTEYNLLQKSSGLLSEPQLLDFLTPGKHNSAAIASEEASDSDMSFWAVLLLVILGGLGLNLTPCVLPMIPVNLAIIGADANTSGKWRGFRRGAAYGLGIMLTYGLLGILAVLTGSRFGALNSSAVFNWVIAAIFVLLALGMFGVYELDLSTLSNIFNSRKSGRKRQLPPEITAFLFGIAAALLAGACVAPVVITVILLTAKWSAAGNHWALALPFALGFAMALPWPLLGMGMSILPKPGMWMVKIKQLFGVVILLMAFYYGYLGWSLRSGAFAQSAEIRRLASELEQTAAGEVVLIDCWASWCKNCHALEKIIESSSIQAVLQQKNIKLIRFRAERLNDPAVKAFMDKFQLPGLPSLLLLQRR